ncbi:MAG: prephenate dehydrogenase/arogenate dehydrogenase family protein, partial [Sporomusa sp.]
MRKSVTRITIIGMGLIGGSLGLAFKAAQDGKIEVTGVDNNELSLVKARQRGAADVVTSDFKASVVNADMVFLCTPVLQVPAL